MTDPNKPDSPVGDDDWAAAMSEQQDDATCMMTLTNSKTKMPPMIRSRNSWRITTAI